MNKGTEKKSVLKNYSIERVTLVGKNDTVFFDLKVNDVMIYGCHVVEGKNGDFISFPKHKGKDGKYYSYAYIALTDEEQEGILLDVEKKLNEK